jgi:hypothetical protein
MKDISSVRFWNILHQIPFWDILHQVRSGISFIRYILEYPSPGSEGYSRAYLMKDIPERT